MERISKLPRPVRSVLSALLGPPLLYLLRYVGSNRHARSASHRAWQQLELGHLPIATYFAQASIACDATWPDGYRVLGLVHVRRGATIQARATFMRGLERAPNDPSLMLALADLEFSSGHYPEAEVHYRRALQLAPEHVKLPEISLALGLTVYKLGRIEESAALLGRARALAPESVNVLMALGEVRLQQRDYLQAIPLFRSVIARDASLARAHYDLGYALASTSQWSDALLAALAAAHLEPNSSNFRDLVNAIEQQRGDDNGQGASGLTDSP